MRASLEQMALDHPADPQVVYGPRIHSLWRAASRSLLGTECSRSNDEGTHLGELWIGHPPVVLMHPGAVAAVFLAQHLLSERCVSTIAEQDRIVGREFVNSGISSQGRKSTSALYQ